MDFMEYFSSLWTTKGWVTGSLGHVWEFPDRWIREKHGRLDALSRWEEVGICR